MSCLPCVKMLVCVGWVCLQLSQPLRDWRPQASRGPAPVWLPGNGHVLPGRGLRVNQNCSACVTVTRSAKRRAGGARGAPGPPQPGLCIPGLQLSVTCMRRGFGSTSWSFFILSIRTEGRERTKLSSVPEDVGAVPSTPAG